jgi:hemerythrin
MRYTEKHFNYEEDLMRAVGYPEVEAHVRQHAWMAGKTRELAMSVIRNQDFFPCSLTGSCATSLRTIESSFLV